MSHITGSGFVLLALLATLGWLGGCEGNNLSTCFDAEDNDGDGYFDCADPGCAQYCTGNGDDDDDDDAGDDDGGDDDVGDDDVEDDDVGDDDVGDDDVGDDDVGDDDEADDDVGDDDLGDDDLGDDDTGPGGALLIQDSVPWGYSSWEDRLAAEGIPTTIAGSWSLGSVALGQFDLVITSSVQGSTSNSALNTELADFESYVAGGGVLVWSVCTQEDELPYPQVPFGGTVVFDLVDDNSVAIPGHPLMAGIATPFTGNYASHDNVANAPWNATTILAHPTYGDPVLYTLEQGSGLLIVHGNPLEFQSVDNADNEQLLANIVDFGWGYAP